MKILGLTYPDIHIRTLREITNLGVDGFVNKDGLHVTCGNYIVRLPSGPVYNILGTRFLIEKFVDIEIKLTERQL